VPIIGISAKQQKNSDKELVPAFLLQCLVTISLVAIATFQLGTANAESDGR
jgi:hypothetical protein